MIFNLNFIWNSMCKGNSCFNIFQNLTGGSIFCPKTQTPSLWGWENAEFEKVSFAKSAKAFDLTLHSHWLTPTTLFKKEWKMQKIVLFKVNFLDDFSHNDFYFFSNIILFVSVNPSRWETLKLAIGFVGKTKNIYIALLQSGQNFLQHFISPCLHVVVSVVTTLRQVHVKNDCQKSSSEICNHLKSYYFTPKDSSTSKNNLV